MKPNVPNITNLLDMCLAQMEAGASIDEIVSGYTASAPEKAEELREILQIVQAAQPGKESLRVPAAAQRTSRQVFLVEAQKLQQQPGAAGLRFWLRFLRFFQHNFGSVVFSAGTIALLFVALASLNALPGDGLYPVKLAAEQAEINLASSGTVREEKVSNYDSRRAEEVSAMIRMQRSGPVRFGGFLRSVNGKQWQVTGIHLQLPAAMEKQARILNGVYVEIKGLLGNQGTVQVESLKPRLEELSGKIARMEPDGWIIDSRLVVITADTQVSGTPQVGSQVSILAAPLADSNQMLAITAAIAGEKSFEIAPPQATPTVTATLTVTPTATTEPTETPMPTMNARQPVETASPSEDHHDGGDSTDSPEVDTPTDPNHD